MALHGEATVGNVHIIYNWTYADAAARTGATGLVAGDVGKFCRQLDNNTIWMLTDDDPVTWIAVTTAGDMEKSVYDTNDDGTVDAADQATDPDAIHGSFADEINILDEKSTPVDGDLLMIEDSEDGNKKKKLQLSNLPAGGGFSTGDIQQVELFRSTLAEAGRFDYSSIPATYDHLLLRAWLRSTATGGYNDVIFTFFNNDTTATNYFTQLLEATSGTTVRGYETDDSYSGFITDNSAPDNSFGYIEMFIPNYASITHLKICQINFALRYNTSDARSGQVTLQWESAEAINRITIQPDGYNTDKFAAGSFCQVIGIKTVA
jgi:hypothetical protein